MTINFFAQNILKGSTFALCLLAILFAAAFVAKAQPSGEKPNCESDRAASGGGWRNSRND